MHSQNKSGSTERRAEIATRATAVASSSNCVMPKRRRIGPRLGTSLREVDLYNEKFVNIV